MRKRSKQLDPYIKKRQQAVTEPGSQQGRELNAVLQTEKAELCRGANVPACISFNDLCIRSHDSMFLADLFMTQTEANDVLYY